MATKEKKNEVNVLTLMENAFEDYSRLYIEAIGIPLAMLTTILTKITMPMLML